MSHCPFKGQLICCRRGDIDKALEGGNNGEARLSLHGLWLLLQIHYYGQ